MATLGSSDTSLCLLAWQRSPGGHRGLCFQALSKSQAVEVWLFSRQFLSVVEASPAIAPSWSAMGDLRPSLREGQRGHGNGQWDEKAPEARFLSLALKRTVDMTG